MVIPAFNEQQRLPATLGRVIEWLQERSLSFWEILVVDDGSTDETVRVAEGFATVRVLRNPGNRGKGYAVRQGMLAARGEWILYSDADLSAPIEEADNLFAAAAKQGAAIAIGSRAVDRALVAKHQSLFREYSGRLFNLIMQSVTGLPFRDTQCGFKLFRADSARAVFSRQLLDGFSFDVEDLFIARRCGIRVVEVPVRWSNVAGSKVRMSAGLRSFGDLLKIRRNGAAGKYQYPP